MLASGSITIVRTGGTADTSSPHNCVLTGTALAVLGSNSIYLNGTGKSCVDAQFLVGGAVYTFTFSGTDAAGNTSTVARTGVTFDNVAPVYSAVSPA